jgi:SHS2 domain-containing protein
MRQKSQIGFREIAHTADWELEVWAPDLSTLLEQAAHGMYHLCEAKLSNQTRISRKIELSFQEPEILLIDFLTELIFLTESEGLAFDQYDLHLEGDQLIALISGSKLDSISKEIKAATFHKLKIVESENGLVAKIVFDV